MTSLMCVLSSPMYFDMIYRTVYDSPCGKHIIPKWIWYSVVATDDCCYRRRRCSRRRRRHSHRRCCCHRHRRVHSRVLNVCGFVTWSEPFVESRSHLTVVANTSIQFTNGTFVVCHHFVIRLVWAVWDCKPVIERFIWNIFIFLSSWNCPMSFAHKHIPPNRNVNAFCKWMGMAADFQQTYMYRCYPEISINKK